MQTQTHDEHHETQPQARTKPRFRIEKLEERIAPTKGGIPGKPGYHEPPGQNCGWGGHKVMGHCQ